MTHLTISEVAQAAGVSKTTLSRYLNGNFTHMSLQTKSKIAAVVTELNYRPNRQAQALKSKASFLIGVIVADITNAYTSQLLKGIGQVLRAQNYQILIMDSANSAANEQAEIQSLIDQRVDGVLLQPISRTSKQYAPLKENGLPTVMLDRESLPLNWPTVVSNNVEATTQLGQEIADQGYQKIVMISEDIHAISLREQRFSAMCAVAKKNKLAFELIEIANHDVGILIKQPIFKARQPKTAFFAANSRTLQTLLIALYQLNLKIPDDFGVTGYDDWNWTAAAGPGMTSIEQHPQQTGNLAAELLLREISGSKVPVKTFMIESEVVTRRSL